MTHKAIWIFTLEFSLSVTIIINNTNFWGSNFWQFSSYSERTEDAIIISTAVFPSM